MAFYTFGAGTYTLASSISSTDTSITLSSFLEPVTGTPYTMALLNTDIVYGTIAPKTTNSEFISFTGITQNADGTATLTGVTRGLAKKYPFTTSSSYKLPHPGQSQFIISDAPQVFTSYGALDNNEVITGLWEAPDPTTAQGLVTRDWILALINGGAISNNNVVEQGIAGETIVAGNLLYFSETDNEWLKTDADTLATVFNVKLGIAQGSGTNGGAISGGVLTYGTYTTSGLTQGDLVYASNTAGAFASGTAGTVPRVIGIAKDATTLYFDPYFQSKLYDYAVDAVGTDSYAITLPGALSVPFVGMEVNFKAGTANTGACTLAINGGSAKAIVKGASTALQDGDILQNQIVKIVYNGTAWQILNPVYPFSYPISVAAGGRATASPFKNGNTTKNVADASGTQTIAHGLGIIPQYVRISASLSNGATGSNAVFNLGRAETVYNGTTQSSNSTYVEGTTNSANGAYALTSSSFIIYGAGGTNYQTGVVTFDATNITITWTKTNTPTGTAVINWEAYA